MHFEITDKPLAPWQRLADYERESAAIYGGPGEGHGAGACATFIGTMRDSNEGDAVQAMTLEHYPGMTERHLAAILAAAAQRWALLDALLVHRVGELSPGDPIVLVAVWSAHRADAFEACRFCMEDLKSRAPFWKKEKTASGERWVERNTDGYTNQAEEKQQ